MKQLDESPKAMSLHNNKNYKFSNKTAIPSFISTAHSDQNSNMKVNNIFTIVKINFPTQYDCYVLSTGHSQQMIKQNNYEEHLNKILKQIKQDTTEKVRNLQTELGSMEMELKLVRESRTTAEQKIKRLQKQLGQLNEKIRGKEYDTYGKNEQIFQSKRKIEQLQKQLIKRSLYNKQIAKEYEELKRTMEKQLEKQIQHQQEQKQWNEKRTIDLERKLEIILRQNMQYKAQINKISKQFKDAQEKNYETNQKLDQLFYEYEKAKKLASQLLNNQCNYCSNSKMVYEEPQSNRSNPNIRLNIPNSKTKRMMDSQLEDNFSMRPRVMSKSRTDRPSPSTAQLEAQVKQLRENQSILIDKLSERDQVIQNLSASISNNSNVS